MTVLTKFDCLKMFNSVSILFADVVTFTEICSRLSPMEVVSMLNGMYSIFDTLTERNKVYKVGLVGVGQSIFRIHFVFCSLIDVFALQFD